MATNNTAASIILAALQEQDLTVAWLARRTGVPYKRLLAQVLHQTRPIELDTAVAAAPVLGLNFLDLVPERQLARAA